MLVRAICRYAPLFALTLSAAGQSPVARQDKRVANDAVVARARRIGERSPDYALIRLVPTNGNPRRTRQIRITGKERVRAILAPFLTSTRAKGAIDPIQLAEEPAHSIEFFRDRRTSLGAFRVIPGEEELKWGPEVAKLLSRLRREMESRGE